MDGMHVTRVEETAGLADYCPILGNSIDTVLQVFEVGLWASGPLTGPEITIPGIVGIALTRAVLADLPPIGKLASHASSGDFVETAKITTRYCGRIATSAIEDTVPTPVANILRQFGMLTTNRVSQTTPVSV